VITYLQQQHYEADFRFNLVRVRENSEQIALLEGERAEETRLLDSFTRIVANWRLIIIVFGLLPFFTLGEDTVMYKSVALDVVLLFVLIITLFATSKSIFDEIEDRTMLTLMSKPVRKWEVLVGKYLGIILSALLAVTITR